MSLSRCLLLLAVMECKLMTASGFSVGRLPFLGMSNTRLVHQRHFMSPPTPETAAVESFIDSELRGAAMKLHTKAQAPSEGKAEAPSPPPEPHVTTHADYLQFLVDSKHVYEALEEIVEDRDELQVFRKTGLERTKALEVDIDFMVIEFGLKRPSVGEFGTAYANALRAMESTPAFLCHYYNFYFAHTAGGRMIGKQMSKLLLDGKTLEFYKWDGDLNETKGRVKGDIEQMVGEWSREQKDVCVEETAAAFQLGGGINAYLAGVYSRQENSTD